MSAPRRQRADADEAGGDDATSLKGAFVKDLGLMMYGFGDDISPLPETVDLVEELVIQYASGVLKKAMDSATLRGKSKPPLKGIGAVTAEDIMAVVRNDPKKYDRIKELFELQKELKEARSAFEDTSGAVDVEVLENLSKQVDDNKAPTA